MSEPRPAFDVLQRWMQTVITHPGGISAGVECDAARQLIPAASNDLEQVVSRSQSLSALERLEIYNRAYLARLLECLKEEYSVLAAALGDELFGQFAIGYLQEHPSRSYTLAQLGARFPEYLAATRPAGTKVGGDWADFLIDLARLERAVNEVFDGPGVEGAPLLDVKRLGATALEQWPGTRLMCAPCLRLLRLMFPVNDYFTAVRRGEHPAIPDPAETYIAVTRRDWRVLRFELDRIQYELLQSLQAGEPIGAAIERAAAASPLGDDALASRFQSWFREWTAAGFFCAVAPSA